MADKMTLAEALEDLVDSNTAEAVLGIFRAYLSHPDVIERAAMKICPVGCTETCAGCRKDVRAALRKPTEAGDDK